MMIGLGIDFEPDPNRHWVRKLYPDLCADPKFLLSLGWIVIVNLNFF